MAAPRGFTYLVCERCGLGRLDPLPDPTTITDLFGPRYLDGGVVGGYDDYDRDAALHRRNARRRLGLLESELGRPGALLDIGCASGYLLAEATRRGWRAVGVEATPEVAERAEHVSGSPARLSIEQASGDGPFDAVCFFQVLEHLVDPLNGLATARAQLAPSGVLVVETWDDNHWLAKLLGSHWQQINPPTVIWLFGRRSLPGVLAAAGLRAGPPRRTVKWVSAGLVSSLLSARPGRGGGSDRRRHTGVGLPYFLRDLMTVVARPT